VLDVDEVGGRSSAPSLPGGLRVLTETMPGVLSARSGNLGGVGTRVEDGPAGRLLALSRALLFKGKTSRKRAGDRDGHGRRRR
jgi:hypothetical protein